MTLPSRRSSLKDIQASQLTGTVNIGLWFNKFLHTQPQKEIREKLEPYNSLIDECIDLSSQDSAEYQSFFTRWEQMLKSMNAVVREVSAENMRLAIGLGNASTIENGCTFHHTYGVPIIPGSSLKGLASSYASQKLTDGLWTRGKSAHEVLFGSTESAGYVTFFDALPKPGKWKLHRDVMTVHHQDYYQNASKPPADWDNPIPIPFMTASGTFLVALYAMPEARAWAEAGLGILRHALADEGIGGKTSSGYGRLCVHLTDKEKAEQEAKEAAKKEKEAAEREKMQQESQYEAYLEITRNQLRHLLLKDLPKRIGKIVNQFLKMNVPDDLKQPVADQILERIEEHPQAEHLKTAKWYRPLLQLSSKGGAE